MANNTLSAVEAELYDRQIRLWGIESQQKLRAANVLLIGVRGLGSEVAKDILLSGINSLTILDDATVSESDYFKNFLLSEESIGKKFAEEVLPKAQALNPLVKITVDTDHLSQKDDSFFKNFTIIIGTSLSSTEIISLSQTCRKNNIKLICGEVFGMFGYTLSDFQEHEYFVEIPKLILNKKRKLDGERVKYDTVMIEEHAKIQYPDLKCVLDSDDKAPSKRRNHLFYLMLVLLKFKTDNSRSPSSQTKDSDLEKLKQCKNEILSAYSEPSERIKDEVLAVLFDEMVPICAIVGGVLAQEVIKAVSGKEVPINNTFLFDPITYNGKEELIGA